LAPALIRPDISVVRRDPEAAAGTIPTFRPHTPFAPAA
jgi:hypothetical protein